MYWALENEAEYEGPSLSGAALVRFLSLRLKSPARTPPVLVACSPWLGQESDTVIIAIYCLDVSSCGYSPARVIIPLVRPSNMGKHLGFYDRNGDLWLGSCRASFIVVCCDMLTNPVPGIGAVRSRSPGPAAIPPPATAHAYRRYRHLTATITGSGCLVVLFELARTFFCRPRIAVPVNRSILTWWTTIRSSVSLTFFEVIIDRTKNGDLSYMHLIYIDDGIVQCGA